MAGSQRLGELNHAPGIFCRQLADNPCVRNAKQSEAVQKIGLRLLRFRYEVERDWY